jgi:ribosome maturation factor RimP
MIDREIICRLVEEKLAASAYYLVDVTVKPGNLIVVEIDSDEAVGIDDCAALSRHIESRLDREEDDYELEVGSAGITSPFKQRRQYRKYIGKEVEVGLKNGVKQTGILKAAGEEGITLTLEKQVKPEGGGKRKIKVKEELSYTFDEIKYAKYVLRFK